MTKILLVGIPRSGTTWLSRLLAADDSVALVHEPDDHFVQPFAFAVKRRLPGRFFPVLEPDQPAPDYELLWRHAAGLAPTGRPRTQVRGALARRAMSASPEPAVMSAMVTERCPLHLRLAAAFAVPKAAPRGAERLVIKSVYSALALEWIATRVPVTPVIIYRTPLNVLSSWSDLGWLDATTADDMLAGLGDAALDLLPSTAVEPSSRSTLARAAQLFSLLANRLLELRERHPDWPFVAHQNLCADPETRVRELADDLGLPWSAASARELSSMDHEGHGYATTRLTREQGDVWRSRLTEAQADEIATVLAETGNEHLLSNDPTTSGAGSRRDETLRG